MDSFQHTPLDRSKDCIRLLRFVDQPPSSELDHFSLDTYNIATAPPFVALSYAWGSPEPSYYIFVNGSSLTVRENLRAALKALRSFFPDKAPFLDTLRRLSYRGEISSEGVLQGKDCPFMWIDAICINQSDPLEKNHQVNMMGRIFSTAERVISWLGDEADNSGWVIRTIRRTKSIRQYGFEGKQAMQALAKRPYWRRMWVIQEFVLPDNLVVLCGHEGVWWEDLLHFWHDEKFVYGTEWIDLYRYSNGESILTVGEGGMAALIFARWSRRGGYLHDFDYGTRPLSVDKIMTRFTYGECSDPRDRIYALLALIKPQAGVEPLLADYEVSAEELYYKVLGYLRPMKQSRYWRRFRKQLREALGSTSWVDAEAAKLHEVVYEIVGIEDVHEWSVELAVTREERHLFTRVQQCLAKHLEQPIDGIFYDGDWIYHDMIRHFQAFPQGEDPEPWRRFDNLLLRWLQILPAIDG